MAADEPPWTADFVVDVTDVPRERHARWDLFDPVAQEPRPLIVFVHGGPVPPDLPKSPRDWPVYRGYGALAAAAGCVGMTVDHRFHTRQDYATAFEDVLEAVGEARADTRVDADRIGIWVFSGGGPLLAPLLAGPPSWLRCLAGTYPILDSRPGLELPAGFRPIDSLGATEIPLVLTVVGLESEAVAVGVSRFLRAAQELSLPIRVIDHPAGHHGFDSSDYTDDSRRCVKAAVSDVAQLLRR